MVETNTPEFLEKFGRNEAYTLALLLDNDYASVMDELARQSDKNKAYIAQVSGVLSKVNPFDAANSLIADAAHGRVDLNINVSHIPFKSDSSLFQLMQQAGMIKSDANAKGGFLGDIGDAIGGFWGGIVGGVLTPVAGAAGSILATPTSQTTSSTGAAATAGKKKDYTWWIVGGIAALALIIVLYLVMRKKS